MICISHSLFCLSLLASTSLLIYLVPLYFFCGRISTEHSPKLQIRSHSYLRAVSEVSINRSLDSLDPAGLLASPKFRSRNESYMRAMSTISQVSCTVGAEGSLSLAQIPPACFSRAMCIKVLNWEKIQFSSPSSRRGYPQQLGWGKKNYKKLQFLEADDCSPFSGGFRFNIKIGLLVWKPFKIPPFKSLTLYFQSSYFRS